MLTYVEEQHSEISFSSESWSPMVGRPPRTTGLHSPLLCCRPCPLLAEDRYSSGVGQVSYDTFRRIRVYWTLSPKTEKDIPTQGAKFSTGCEDSSSVGKKVFQAQVPFLWGQEGVEGSVHKTAIPSSLNTKVTLEPELRPKRSVTNSILDSLISEIGRKTTEPSRLFGRMREEHKRT